MSVPIPLHLAEQKQGGTCAADRHRERSRGRCPRKVSTESVECSRSAEWLSAMQLQSTCSARIDCPEVTQVSALLDAEEAKRRLDEA